MRFLLLLFAAGTKILFLNSRSFLFNTVCRVALPFVADLNSCRHGEGVMMDDFL